MDKQRYKKQQLLFVDGRPLKECVCTKSKPWPPAVNLAICMTLQKKLFMGLVKGYNKRGEFAGGKTRPRS